MTTRSPHLRTRSVFVAWVLLCITVCASLAGCGETRPALAPVPTPEVSAYERSVQNAVATSRARFEQVSQSKASNAQLADAYGDLAMTYHAQDLPQPAEIAYKNARLLAPHDKRWSYLLGHLYNDTARPAEAVECFEAALAIDGNDAAALLSLGELDLKLGNLDRAQQAFDKLAQNKGAKPVALAGQGKVALAQRNYKAAAGYLEEALRLSPGASKLRYPLAMAYQGAGDRDQAAKALQGYSATGPEPLLVDPLADALGAKAASSRALLRRGQRYGQAGRFDLAAQVFQSAAEAKPHNAEILANLGISLANIGRLEDAQRTLTESLQIDGANALAHLSLAVVFDRQGHDDEAMAQYQLALQRDPKNVQAIVYLADAKMRSGHAPEAASLYGQALAIEPSERARLSLVFSEVNAGRYAEARRQLEAGLAEDARNQPMANALARIMAAAPDDQVRDGPRALEVAKQLFESTRSPEVGQTFAMAMAANGDFEHAVKLQQETIIAYDRMGLPQTKPFLERNLALYRQNKPAREPWPADDSIFFPRSPAVARTQRRAPKRRQA